MIENLEEQTSLHEEDNKRYVRHNKRPVSSPFHESNETCGIFANIEQLFSISKPKDETTANSLDHGEAIKFNLHCTPMLYIDPTKCFLDASYFCDF